MRLSVPALRAGLSALEGVLSDDDVVLLPPDAAAAAGVCGAADDDMLPSMEGAGCSELGPNETLRLGVAEGRVAKLSGALVAAVAERDASRVVTMEDEGGGSEKAERLDWLFVPPGLWKRVVL